MNNLLAKFKHYYQTNYDLLQRSYEMAYRLHNGQKRLSGEEYFVHPYNVAEILVDLGLDAPTISAALLHDTVEDTGYTNSDIQKTFGDEIANLVEGVTKLSKINFSSKEEEESENLRKMFIAMAKDVRVIFIKLADRLDNMRTLQYLPENRQKLMARETLDIYAPLAGRLGISHIKCELEDLSFMYLEPESFADLNAKITQKRSEREEFVKRIIIDIKNMLKEINIEGEVFGRPKHFYSIYKKIVNQHKTLEEIYDLTAVRIIVGSIMDCYEVLGTIHTKFKPIPGRIKDYIATPKVNMYQSLHTTVITNYGQPFEIQIRTKEMHRVAEYGIAAHWKYKEGKTSTSNLDEKLSWLREIIENEEGQENFYDNLKLDLGINEVLVFTPKGDVISLPQGSTPIDFAYHIHSQIGNKCVGGKIGGKIVPLDYKLQLGDVVEIVTNQSASGPSWDWLKIVKSSGAKSKIRQYFKKEMKEENIKKGKEMVELDVKKKGYTVAQLVNENSQKILFDKFGFKTMDEVYAAVGYGGITINQVVFKLIEFYKNVESKEDIPIEIKHTQKRSTEGILVGGNDGMLIRFAGCCNPVPGDKIIGFVSRGRGVAIHRADCCNIQIAEKDRLIDAEWTKASKSTYSISVQIVAEDSTGLIAEVTAQLVKMHINITNFNARVDKKKQAIISLTLQIYDANDFEEIKKKLLELPSVKEIFRL